MNVLKESLYTIGLNAAGLATVSTSVYVGSFVTGFNPMIGCVVLATDTLIGTIIDLTRIGKVAPITSLFLKTVGALAATYFVLNMLAPITFVGSIIAGLYTVGTGLLGSAIIAAVALPIFCIVGCGVGFLGAKYNEMSMRQAYV